MKRVTLTLKQIADILSIDDMSTPCEYDMTDVGLRIKTPAGFKGVHSYIVKESVNEHYRLGELCGTSVHRVLHNDEWVMLKDHPGATRVDSPINVVDLSVPDGECYIANGHVNHNTTPGGEMLASHARA
jgi:hypothetical protein